MVHGVSVTSDGGHAVLGVQDLGLHSISLSFLNEESTTDPDGLCSLGELASGFRIIQGEALGLSTEEWLNLWSAFRLSHP